MTDKISELIKRCYNEKKLEYINVSDNYIARWSSKTRGKWSFKIDDVIDIFKFIMDNISINFQGKIYRQIVGIPMGNNCAPQIADIFLYWYEHNMTNAETSSLTLSHSLTLNLIYLIIPIMELLLENCIDYVNPVHL